MTKKKTERITKIIKALSGTKCFKVYFSDTNYGRIVIRAETFKQAKDFVNSGNIDDLDNFHHGGNFEVVDIEETDEEEDYDATEEG